MVARDCRPGSPPDGTVRAELPLTAARWASAESCTLPVSPMASMRDLREYGVRVSSRRSRSSSDGQGGGEEVDIRLARRLRARMRAPTHERSSPAAGTPPRRTRPGTVRCSRP